MSLIKSKIKKKLNHPFPFSAYVIKSYSTEASKQPQSHYSKEQKNNIIDLDQYLNVLEINKHFAFQKIYLRPQEFRKTQTVIRDHIFQSQNKVISPDQPSAKKDLSSSIPKQENKFKTKSLSPVKKQKITENKHIIVSLRYQIVSLFSLLFRREDFMASLKGKSQILGTPLKSNEISQKLQKYEETKGKDKGRVKFNFITNEQLRSLKYKAKQPLLQGIGKKQQKQKVQYDDEEQDEEEDAEEKEEVIDFQTWKKRNGVGYNQKVFIIKGGYAELRRSLAEKGWFENEDVWSPFYDFKWTTRICDINYMSLKHNQAVNHFNNNHHLTSKYGITRRLRTLALSYGIDSDKFYPKCFDLGDQVDFQNFIENFKFSFAESVAKRFLGDKNRYKGLEAKVRIVYEILKKRAVNFSQMINNINKGIFPTISPDEWAIITETAEIEKQMLEDKLNELRKLQKVEIESDFHPQSPQYQQQIYEKIDEKIKKQLDYLKKSDPQYDINGMRNVWIAKPNFMSRGRGIRCFNNIYDISDYCLGQSCQFVVQKYIENPLLVEGRKFDIRQWVLINDFNPPKIWFYEECYIRFCCDEYSLDNIYNRFMHLTNNSVQKYSKKHVAEKSMWTMGEFKDFIGEEKWAEIQQKMKNIVVWSIKSCEGYVIGKKGSLELVGYDFMIDQNLNPWLIEINMSPSMDYSTSVTKKLVKQVLQDTAKVMNSSKKQKTAGLFTCIYKGNQDLEHFKLYSI